MGASLSLKNIVCFWQNGMGKNARIYLPWSLRNILNRSSTEDFAYSQS